MTLMMYFLTKKNNISKEMGMTTGFKKSHRKYKMDSKGIWKYLIYFTVLCIIL